MNKACFVAFLAVACISCSFASSDQSRPTLDVKVDQVGYSTGSRKVAIITSSRTARVFSVHRVADGAVVFHGKISSPVRDALSGDRVQSADFSKLNERGRYYIEVAGVGRSFSFTIEPDVYSRAYYLTMRAFYGQRCGIAVDLGSEFSGYAHTACHSNGAFHATSGKQGPRNNLGGWHDAGDYGRYVVNSGISTGSLLWAWEMYAPALANRSLNIPETNNGTPDILNEARWNLEWMLEMQDEDGGVWHKQTSENFSGFVSPEGDTLTSVVIGTGSAPFKSTCATADLAAVAAIAARVYVPFDPKFASRNLQAAATAWTWTEQNPSVTYRNPTGILTGEYGDSDCSDERLWAAAELWRTTGDQRYQDYFLANYKAFFPTLDSASADSWAQMAPMALWTYGLANRAESNTHAVKLIRKRTVRAAKQIAKRTRNNPYRNSLRVEDYVWGSNGLTANYAMELMVANVFHPKSDFTEAASDDLHYLFGRNTFSLSFVTQLGENPLRHPHHRPSGARKNVQPWPGLLAGGPNSHRQDVVLRAMPDLPPAKMYADDVESYASNEVAINWQAALVFALAGTLQKQ